MPAPTAPRTIFKPRLLIGEGEEEVFFFEALLAYLHIDDIQVEQYGGKAGLSRYLRGFSVRPGHERVVALGITRDADDDCPGAFQHACGCLTGNGFAPPAQPGQITAGLFRVGVFIMPDNRNPGMLEDLCLEAVRSDPAFPCLEAYFQCVLRCASRNPNYPSKARVHAWLSSQVEPDLRLGEAAGRGYWPWTDPAFAALIGFVQFL